MPHQYATPTVSRVAHIAAFLVIAVLAASACSHESAVAPPSIARRIQNLHAFARLYGVVRWFHPSDAAAAIDWNRFAVDGAHAVADAPDVRALRDGLDTLFAPIAPTVRIAGPGDALADDPVLPSRETTGLQRIAWQHDGFGDTTEMRVYHSQRHVSPYGDARAAIASVDLDLGLGIRARIPIELPARDGHTLGDDPRLARWWQQVAPPRPPGFDPLTGASDVIVAWNALEHFWGYWDDVDRPVDWDRELDVALADSLDDRSADDHVATLSHLSAALPDGHARVTCPGASPRAYLPADLDWIDDRISIKASIDPQLRPGDVLLATDGVDARTTLDAETALVSGSPQFRQVRALHHLGAGAPGARAHLRIERAGRALEVDVARVAESPYFEYARPPFELLDGGVWYVDLSRVSLDESPTLVDKLALARGIVFDMRHYPLSNNKLIGLLIASSDDSTWLHVPRFTRPDHVATQWRDVDSREEPDPRHHLAAPVAFLIGPRQFSYGESVLGYVAALRLGALVGAPTAGINGNIAGVAEPSGCVTTFTGMRATNHDGSRHYQRGIAPTVPVAPTLAGIRANRDEVLDAGVAVVRAPAVGARSSARPR